LGQTNAAIALYRQALDQHPSFAEAHAALGEIFLQTDKVAAAADSFAKAVKARPDYLVARLNLALLLARMGQRADAMQQLQAVLQLDPTNAIAGDLLRQLSSAADMPVR
jgi:tetratricopeptide (TPR) repeat protein